LTSQPNVPRRKTGLLFLARNSEEHQELKRLEGLGLANGESVRIIDRDELGKLEPDLCLDEVDSALFSPEEFVVDSYLLPLSNLVPIQENEALLVNYIFTNNLTTYLICI
jgi:L-2-hydroxyglutarate oxidase LhgO